MSNISQDTAAFVNSCMYPSGEQEVQEEADKKMRGAFNIGKQEECKRKNVCFDSDKKKIYG